MYFIVRITANRGSFDKFYATIEEAQSYFNTCIGEKSTEESELVGSAVWPDAACKTDDNLSDTPLLIETRVYLGYTVNLLICKGSLPLEEE